LTETNGGRAEKMQMSKNQSNSFGGESNREVIVEVNECCNPQLSAFLIALPPVVERKPNPDTHETQGWNQKHKDASADGALTVLAGAGRIRVAHGAALG